MSARKSAIEEITALVVLSMSLVGHDPNVWSGRALQEVFVDPADAVSH